MVNPPPVYAANESRIAPNAKWLAQRQVKHSNVVRLGELKLSR